MAMAAALLILMLAAPAVRAVQHIVGGSSNWNTNVNYDTWAAGQKFVVGDTLLFNYGSDHKVDVVNQADYTNCASGNALQSYSSGATTINLTTAGTMYFLCPTPGHCGGGMKLQVNVSAATTTPSGSPTTPSTSPSGSPSPPTTTTRSPPPPPPSKASSVCDMNHLMLGLSIALVTVLAFTS